METIRRGKPDFIILISTFLLLSFGILMVYSASYAYALDVYHKSGYFVQKQAVFLAAGTFLMFFFMNLRYGILKRLSVPLLVVSIVLLVLVLLIGKDVNGARRWLGVGSLGIQPTEFVKLAIVLYLSNLISKKKEKLLDFKKGLLPLLVVSGLVSLLILLQPDFGSCLIILLVSFTLIIVGGVNFKHILFIALAAAPLLLYVVIAKSYRLKRITSFLHPWDDPNGSGYQLIQSMYALAHGYLTGVGIGNSIQKLYYLPEAHTDFIFAIIGEEIGFVGVIVLLLVFALLLYRGFVVALRCPDPFGFLLGFGVVSMIGIQLIFNIGADSGLLPVTGVPLPFISYGGSSLLVTMSAVGILLSISRERPAESQANDALPRQVRPLTRTERT